ncbi:alpha/beta hydrolase [Marmoricola sp. RAF53]|uniref:alpha/beta hydrolase n=1 Tax=Marmoricola sp. RAF53 TaxID=3233059 RepID=UPI003F9C7864
MNGARSEGGEYFVAADGETPLPLHVLYPAQQPRAALLLFHGGGWRRGRPTMLVPHARKLADAGILTASAGYRLVGAGAATPADCLADAAQADRAFRTIAERAGLDNIAIGGGSAGAQLALALAMPPGGQESHGYTGLVLFNPAVDQCCNRGLVASLVRRSLRLTPEGARAASPLHHVRGGMPPSLMFHGTHDRLVPIELARRFQASMEAAGNDCELVEFAGARHGFFLDRREGNPALERSIELIKLLLLVRAVGSPTEARTVTGKDRE